MAQKKEDTASFVLRFTQKIYEDEAGKPQVQWRGNIRHVQSGEEKRFAAFEEATDFVQQQLSDLTFRAVEDKSPEEQKGILSLSVDLFLKAASVAPKLVRDSIKDPKKQVAQIQEQIQEQIHQVGDALGQRLEIDEWRGASKSDLKSVLKALEQLTEQVDQLHTKVDGLTKKGR